MDGIERNGRRKYWILVLHMAEYIFYTTEGFAQAPNGDDVENCQLVGRAFGNDENEAKNNLLKENPWIEEYDFDKEMFIGKELAPCKNVEKQLFFLVELLDDKQLNEYTEWLNSVK